jgi:hypothetical protein
MIKNHIDLYLNNPEELMACLGIKYTKYKKMFNTSIFLLISVIVLLFSKFKI